MTATPVVATGLSPNPASGTTTTDGTEQVLASGTSTPGDYVFALDATNMVDGDTIELRVYTVLKSAGSYRQAYFASFSNTQTDAAKVSICLPSVYGYKATLKRTAGTDRAYDWAVLAL